MKTGFFAYSGQPRSSGESVEEAIRLINSSGVASLKSWISYAVNGRLIIDEVTMFSLSLVMRSQTINPYFCFLIIHILNRKDDIQNCHP
jgi:hypothetical protein